MKLQHCEGYLVTYSVFSGKLQILRFRILTAVNMWKNGFFDHPLAPEGWHRLKLALNDLFITMKWLLTCLDCICSFLLRPCANRRLFIGSIYRHGHGQACPGEKLRTFMKFFHRLKMVQFAKLMVWVSWGGTSTSTSFKMNLINVPLILSEKSFGSVAKTCVQTFLRKNEIYR